jgi:hypothetical protein
MPDAKLTLCSNPRDRKLEMIFPLKTLNARCTAMKRHGLHVMIPAAIVGPSVNPSADRSDNHSTRSNNNSTWRDNDRVGGDAARPVYSGRSDDGVCFRCRQGNEASY